MTHEEHWDFERNKIGILKGIWKGKEQVFNFRMGGSQARIISGRKI